jgi:hypothetical protein
MNRAQRRHPDRLQPTHSRPGADARSLPRLMARLEPFTASELLELQLPVHSAFEALRTGQGHEDDYHTLAAAVNTALIRSEAIDPLCVETCQRAQAALLAMRARFDRTGRWGVDHASLQDLPPALDLHDQLLAMSTPKQMADALSETLRRMHAGHVFQTADQSN